VNLGAAIWSETILDGAGTLYVGADDGKLYALDSRKGGVKWTHAVGDKVRGEPAVANGMVYITTINKDEFLHAVGPATPAPAPSPASTTTEGVSGAWKAYAIVLTVVILAFLAGAAFVVPKLRGARGVDGYSFASETTANPFIELPAGPGAGDYAAPGVDGI